MTDHIKKGDSSVDHCPTEKMIGDFCAKPLHGKKFKEFRKTIMEMHNWIVALSTVHNPQECVGE